MRRCGIEVDPPATELDGEQDVERLEPGGLDGEEVAGDDPYTAHDNRGRPHRALALASPLPGARDPITVSPRDVRRRDLLGGLIHKYHAAAA